jgi:hypothetical protein
MKILVFLHGTTIMHRSAYDQPREVRVRQVMEREASVRAYDTYIPIANAVTKVQTWNQQGAEIVYLSSHRLLEHVAQDQSVLQRFAFPLGPVEYRHAHETYGDVVERVMPDVLIEDDCESIGGERAMIAPHLPPHIQAHLRIWVVPEFAGIDTLPDALAALQQPA